MFATQTQPYTTAIHLGFFVLYQRAVESSFFQIIPGQQYYNDWYTHNYRMLRVFEDNHDLNFEPSILPASEANIVGKVCQVIREHWVTYWAVPTVHSHHTDTVLTAKGGGGKEWIRVLVHTKCACLCLH